jgi:hypothetical protein
MKKTKRRPAKQRDLELNRYRKFIDDLHESAQAAKAAIDTAIRVRGKGRVGDWLQNRVNKECMWIKAWVHPEDVATVVFCIEALTAVRREPKTSPLREQMRRVTRELELIRGQDRTLRKPATRH